MEEEDEDVIPSSDSSDSYMEESQDSEGENENSEENPDGEDLAVVSPPSDADRKRFTSVRCQKKGFKKLFSMNSTRQGNLLSTEDLRDLFSFRGDVRSEIHEKMSCTRCQNDVSSTENIEEGNENNVDGYACQIDREDIGGFAKDAFTR